jgi:hypothetical protein
MPKYVTIGYGDQAGYERTAIEVRDAAHAHDEELLRRGALMGVAGPPVQVRNPDDAGVQTKNGPFMSSPLPIAGFAVIEAANLAEAIDLVSRFPVPLLMVSSRFGLWKDHNARNTVYFRGANGQMHPPPS